MRDFEERDLRQIVQHGFQAMLDIFIPRKCVVCEKTLGIYEKHLCQECIEDVPYTYFWLRKFNPMADRMNALIQQTISEKPPHREYYAYAAALYFYRADSGYSEISRQLKYHGNIPAGRFFGQLLGKRLAQAKHLADVDVVIPIPLHWTRRWSRGYNQAEIIAREVAYILGVDLRTDILKRRRRTRTQTKLSIEGKAANVHGAFRVRTHIARSLSPDAAESPSSKIKKADTLAISNLKHLLIVDDVFTTGSTLMACYEALRQAFPSEVRISVATLAFVGEG